MFGYCGRWLHVDLSSGRVGTRDLDREACRKYIGGSGLAARLLVDGIHPGLDPLGPDNTLAIFTGPLNGTALPAAGRFAVAAISPLTGIWGECSVGGMFGPELKFAGYDGIIVRGASPSPVYLRIADDRAELRDARALWGRDTYDCHAVLSESRGPKPARVLAIGPAGENLVRFAAAVHDRHHVAGRTGMGAVMGAKKLKAVVVSGSGRVTVADREGVAAARRRLLGALRESLVAQAFRAVGTMAALEPGMLLGNIPIRNWRDGEWDEGIEKVGSGPYGERLVVGSMTCFACPLACKRVVRVAEGPFRTGPGPGPEYETCASLGPLIGNDSLEAIARANELCNRYGLDTISCGGIVAFLMDCFEHGVVSRSDLDGLDLSWGRMDSVLRLLEMIAYRRGVGDVLAEGSERAAARFGGKAAACLTTVKGLEAPMHDPRALPGMALAYATSPRGACHMLSVNMGVELGSASYPEVGLGGPFPERSSTGRAALTVKAQDLSMALGSAGVCQLAAMVYPVPDVAAMLRCVTGEFDDMEQVMACGERIWFLKRAIGHILGATREDDRLPRKLLTPVSAGPTAGFVPDLDLMLREFYALRGLDERGFPRREKLVAVGLADIADRVHGRR